MRTASCGSVLLGGDEASERTTEDGFPFCFSVLLETLEINVRAVHISESQCASPIDDASPYFV